MELSSLDPCIIKYTWAVCFEIKDLWLILFSQLILWQAIWALLFLSEAFESIAIWNLLHVCTATQNDKLFYIHRLL